MTRSIPYEDRFARDLPAECFPLPIPGEYRESRRGGPPLALRAGLRIARRVLDERQVIPYKSWPWLPGKPAGPVSSAVMNLLSASCYGAQLRITIAEEESPPKEPDLSDLTSTVALVEAWDVPGLTVKAYLQYVRHQRNLARCDWVDSTDYGPHEFSGLVNLAHAKQIFDGVYDVK